jgi:hypothetical protein
MTGLARSTLWSYASVARSYESLRRRKDVSFNKHRIALYGSNGDGDPVLVRYEVVTERQRQLAEAAARKVSLGMASIDGYCTGTAVARRRIR